VSEGGLGLRPDNTPEERAAAMGFDTDAYRGYSSPEHEISPEATFTTSDPYIASGYADPDRGAKLPSVIPLKLRMGETAVSDYGGQKYTDKGVAYRLYNEYVDAKKAGNETYLANNIRDSYDSSIPVKPHDMMISFDPRNIRSRFAAFDPMRRDSGDIMAGLAPFGAIPWLYGDDQ
jgi:hypothetical protein